MFYKFFVILMKYFMKISENFIILQGFGGHSPTDAEGAFPCPNSVYIGKLIEIFTKSLYHIGKKNIIFLKDYLISQRKHYLKLYSS